MAPRGGQQGTDYENLRIIRPTKFSSVEVSNRGAASLLTVAGTAYAPPKNTSKSTPTPCIFENIPPAPISTIFDGAEILGGRKLQPLSVEPRKTFNGRTKAKFDWRWVELW